jgi:hypothetical protein
MLLCFLALLVACARSRDCRDLEAAEDALVFREVDEAVAVRVERLDRRGEPALGHRRVACSDRHAARCSAGRVGLARTESPP